jgi:perosamine synthetase
MIPRKRLDIGWTDLLFGFRQCFLPQGRESVQRRLEETWSTSRANLACLSVRSGFDALLEALAFPDGSEILVSAATIRDMTRIIEGHGLVPIPVDLDMRRLAVRDESLARAATPRTKAILVAHLFGSRMPMAPVLRFARDRRLLVIEDCAQAYAGDAPPADPDSDVHFFSFGPIKTATALAGGILSFRDSSLRDRVREAQAPWGVQNRWAFLARIGKYAILVSLSYRPLYSLFVQICRVLGKSHDEILRASVRGFGGGDFFARIRQKPCAPLLALLERRLKRFDPAAIARRAATAQLAIDLLPGAKRPGDQASRHTHWVFPILHESPDRLMRHLWTRGFDATRGATSLCVVDPPADRADLEPAEARQALARILFLPLDPGVTRRDIERMAQAVNDFAP